MLSFLDHIQRPERRRLEPDSFGGRPSSDRGRIRHADADAVAAADVARVREVEGRQPGRVRAARRAAVWPLAARAARRAWRHTYARHDPGGAAADQRDRRRRGPDAQEPARHPAAQVRAARRRRAARRDARARRSTCTRERCCSPRCATRPPERASRCTRPPSRSPTPRVAPRRRCGT